MQRDRTAADHTCCIAFSDGLCPVLLAFDRVPLASDRLALHEVRIRACGDGAAVRRQRVADDYDLTSH